MRAGQDFALCARLLSAAETQHPGSLFFGLLRADCHACQKEVGEAEAQAARPGPRGTASPDLRRTSTVPPLHIHRIFTVSPPHLRR